MRSEIFLTQTFLTINILDLNSWPRKQLSNFTAKVRAALFQNNGQAILSFVQDARRRQGRHARSSSQRWNQQMGSCQLHFVGKRRPRRLIWRSHQCKSRTEQVPADDLCHLQRLWRFCHVFKTTLRSCLSHWVRLSLWRNFSEKSSVLLLRAFTESLL